MSVNEVTSLTKRAGEKTAKRRDEEPNEAKTIWQRLGERKSVSIPGLVILLGLVCGGPFLPHPVAQILAGILAALLTTLISVYATYHFSKSTARNELTRYGLLAWRNLDSLQVKIAQHLQQNLTVSEQTLHEWTLDVDQGKWAWRDVLREVFELEERLHAEKGEVTREYRDKIQAASNPEDIRELLSQQQAELRRLSVSSRLPFRTPTEVRCPYCGNPNTITMGTNPGDTASVMCPSCEKIFNAHRTGDGTLFTRQLGTSVTSYQKPIIKFVNPVTHLQVLEAVASMFEEAEDNRIGGWQEFWIDLGERLEDQGLSQHEAGSAQKWLFHLKAFQLLGPGNGVKLIVPPRQLIEYVEKRVVQRLPLGTTAEDACLILYGSTTERVQFLRRRIDARILTGGTEDEGNRVDPPADVQEVGDASELSGSSCDDTLD